VAHGLAALLVKPVRQSQLYNTVLEVLGHRPAVDIPAAVQSPPATGHLGLRVLLAEDNPINQKVARRMLEKWGCEVHAVDDGMAAIEALESEAFDVVVMDCHMPKTDGYEATAEIRRREASGQRRVPVIAMTANALEGDRERCLAAGMDDYVRKPVKSEELWEALLRWTGSHEAEKAGRSPLNLVHLLEACGQDAALASELKLEFRKVAPNGLKEIAKAIETGESAKVAFAAHSLKGACWSLGAEALGDVLAEIEEQAKSGSLDLTSALLVRADREYARLEEFLDQAVGSLAA
jgi:CheY-like chemotaxis protein/HPt (histidine-containing phosphotransfer) domain-containing protein